MMFRGRGYVYSALVLVLNVLIGGWFGCMVAALTALYAFFIGECTQGKNTVQFRAMQVSAAREISYSGVF